MDSDIEAPKLISISIDDTLVDVDTGETTLVVTAHFTDDLSGISDGIAADGTGVTPPQIRFRSPSGKEVDGLFDILTPVSGDRLDGVYKATIRFSEYVEAGTWSPVYLILSDEAGNLEFLHPDTTPALASLSFAIANANSDAQAPNSEGIVLSDDEIDIGAGETSLVVTGHFADLGAGLSDGINDPGEAYVGTSQIRFRSPSGSQFIDALFDTAPNSGNVNDGFFQASLTLSDSAEAGLWKAEYLLLIDEAGNHAYTYFEDVDVPSFNVVNPNADVAGPSLSSLQIGAVELNGDGTSTIQVLAGFVDDKSGIPEISDCQIRFVSNSGQIVDGLFDTSAPVSGDRLDGVYQASVTLGAFAEAGVWSVQHVLIFDAAGNMTALSPENSALLAGRTFYVGSGGDDDISGSATNDELYGLAGDDQLTGGDGNDLLDGGEGADNLVGGAGDDTYVVDNVGDQVRDAEGQAARLAWYSAAQASDEDTDTVLASISYTLGSDIENLSLIGQAAIDGTGNSNANAIVGNASSNKLAGMLGNDTLSGGDGDDVVDGGRGDDVMDGGGGADLFRFASRSGRDTISDFDGDEGDRIDLASVPGMSSFKKLMRHDLEEHGSDVWITMSKSDILVIENADADDFSKEDFLF